MDHNLEIDYENLDFDMLVNPSDSKLTVFSGSNNCGKTLLLKLIYEKRGVGGYMFGANRFYNIEFMSVGNLEDADFHTKHHKKAIHQINNSQTNEDINVIPFDSVSSRLKDKSRLILCEIATTLLNEEVKLSFEDPDNSMSRPYYSIDGTKLNKCSSGSRILLYLLSHLLYENNKYILLDEPELGLTPRIQNGLRNILYNCKSREQYFSHIEHIYISTHSHIFLSDRIVENFLIIRNKNKMNIKRLNSYQDLNQLKFKQLGNSFERLHLPTGFVIVEGKTDYKYIERLLMLKFSKNMLNIINACSDGGVKKKVYDLFRVLGDIRQSPYKERVFIVLDSIHTQSISQDLEKQGIDPAQIIIWDRNGIEYYYPISILRDIFIDEKMKISDMKIDGDNICHNGVTKTKNVLCDEVLARMAGDEDLDEELISKLLSKIRDIA